MKSWVHLETSLGFSEGVDGQKMQLTTEGQPLQLKDWMQRHRPYTPNTIHITNIDKFRRDVKKWWNIMQSAWRRVNGNASQVYVPSKNEDWSKLAKASTNGLLLLMLSVGWWGKIETSDVWRGFLMDMLKSFNAMVFMMAPAASPAISNTLSAPTCVKRHQAAAEDVPAPKRTRARSRTRT
ncbi:hypothetical protein BDN71DRAFT_1511845 [Pleurotus eryngii]|uniref:Uncharacterized protein n=1 Tax=Pleurotus eryngii TaxID=5323 RepID=A0A9P6DAI9_PLEER|nr:hypothetical protein BDN71DRAFT_1511845 [Pleurotus eryngii]